MRIAFTTSSTQEWESIIEPRFGRTDFLLVYNDVVQTWEAYDNRDVEDDVCGAGPKMAKLLLEQGIDVLITGNGPGENAAVVLSRGKVEIYVGAGDMRAKDAYVAYQNATLRKF